MKKFLILSFTFLTACVVHSGCSKLTELDNRVQELEERTNLPNSIIVTTKSIGQINKGNTIKLGIIVNPSDFALTQDNLSILANHHLYTAIEPGDDPETPFDKTARCNLKIVGLTPDESVEGAYDLSIAVDGEGNFFDDIDAYIRYDKKDNTGKMRHICSNSSTSILVIPNIRNAFDFEVPNQSFYRHVNDRGGFVEQGVKIQYAGMWMKRYKDASGAFKAYDRSLITSIHLETGGKDADISLDTDYFKTTGYIRMTILDMNDYWVNAVKDYTEKGVTSTTYPKGYGITFARSDIESVTYPLDSAKVFFKTNFSQSKTVKYADLEQTMSIQFNVADELKANGSDGSLEKMQNIGKLRGNTPAPGSGSVIEGDIKNGVINIVFPYLYEKMKNIDYNGYYYHTYHYSDIQDDQGLFRTANEEDCPLLDFFVSMNVRITD